jgi:hypothetical protein
MSLSNLQLQTLPDRNQTLIAVRKSRLAHTSEFVPRNAGHCFSGKEWPTDQLLYPCHVRLPIVWTDSRITFESS